MIKSYVPAIICAWYSLLGLCYIDLPSINAFRHILLSVLTDDWHSSISIPFPSSHREAQLPLTEPTEELSLILRIPNLDGTYHWSVCISEFDPDRCDLVFWEWQAASRPDYFGEQVKELEEGWMKLRDQYISRARTHSDDSANESDTQCPVQRQRLNQE